jgi:cytochrome oxidase Cu insertion factor (SCO1/SenC/PrrC family)
MRASGSLSSCFAVGLAATLSFGGVSVLAQEAHGTHEAHETASEWKPHFPSMPMHQDFGGTFELTDHQGSTFMQGDLKGHYSLLYFGYTSCPDICAVALFTISESLDEVGAPGTVLTPYFINFDPERESLVNLAEYIGFFHEDIVGLTGTAEQLRVVAGAYATRYKQVQAGEEDRKTVHSGMIFLLDPSGQAVAMLPHDVPQGWLTATLREHLPGQVTPPRIIQ